MSYRMTEAVRKEGKLWEWVMEMESMDMRL